MDAQPRPRVVVSRCLGFAACRYNGQVIPDRFVEKLAEHADYLPICPEVEIGLGVPRDPIRVELKDKKRALTQPATGRELSDEMLEFAEKYLSGLEEIDGFILKNKSPSCGIKDVKIYKGDHVADKGAGFFGGEVLERFGCLAVEDEGRLRNHRIREHFLTKIFTFASFREARDLQDFQEKNKLLLMAYNQKEMREMGRIAAGKGEIEEYRKHLEKAFSRAPMCRSNINVLTHAYGFFKKDLSKKEKEYFKEGLEHYRNKEIPLGSILTLIESWTARFENSYLEKQSYFSPYPAPLIELVEECACATDERYAL